jgi:hypothetical protein
METALAITLPARYREFAMRLPNDIEDDAAGDWLVFMNVDEIIERNEELRSGDWVEDWKPNLLCIGTFEGGDYFVDITDLDKGVFYNTLDANGGGQGAPYNAEDYTVCWRLSFATLSSSNEAAT